MVTNYTKYCGEGGGFPIEETSVYAFVGTMSLCPLVSLKSAMLRFQTNPQLFATDDAFGFGQNAVMERWRPRKKNKLLKLYMYSNNDSLS